MKNNHEYFEAIKKDDISFVLKNYPKYKNLRTSYPSGLSSLLYAAHENSRKCINFLKTMESHLRTENDIVITALSLSESTKYTLGQGSTALQLSILRNAGDAANALVREQIGQRNAYGMTSASFAALCSSSLTGFMVFSDEDILLEELPLTEVGESSVLSIIAYFGQYKALKWLFDKINSGTSEILRKLVYRQAGLSLNGDKTLVDIALEPMKYEKFNTSIENKIKCAEIFHELIQQVLDYMVVSNDMDFEDVARLWKGVEVENQFGILQKRSENEIIVENFQKQTKNIDLILREDEDIQKNCELDVQQKIIEDEISHLQYRQKLRIKLELALVNANKFGVQFNKLRKQWFNNPDTDFMKEYVLQFRRTLNLDTGIYQGLLASQIAVITDRFDLLQVVLFEEYQIPFPTNIIIQTEFGPTTIPKGSNLLQIAVTVNAQKCVPFLLENAQKLNYIGHKNEEGESAFTMSIKAKGDAGTKVLDDEAFLRDELLKDVEGECILMKSLKYNNVHMLYKWQALILRVDFAVEIMRMCLLRDEKLNSMIEVCQSEAAAQIIKDLTSQTVSFLVDNYLYNDEFWRDLLKNLFGSQFNSFLDQQIKIQKHQAYILKSYEAKKNSLLAEIVSVENLLQQSQLEYLNPICFNNNIDTSINSSRATVQLSEFQQQLIDFPEVFGYIFPLFPKTISKLYQKKFTSDKVQIFNDIVFKQAIKDLFEYQLEKSYIFPIKPDSRQTDYKNRIFNGFYPIHYAVLIDDPFNFKLIFEEQFLYKTKSSILIMSPGISEGSGIILSDGSSIFQMLLILNKIDLFLFYFNKYVKSFATKQYFELSNVELEILDIFICPNCKGQTLLDIIALLPFRIEYKDVIQHLLKLYFTHSEALTININNIIMYVLTRQNIMFLANFSVIFDIYNQKQNKLVEICEQVINKLSEIRQEKFSYLLDNIQNSSEIKLKFREFYKQCNFVLLSNNFELKSLNVDQNLQLESEEQLQFLKNPIFYEFNLNQVFIQPITLETLDLTYYNNVIQSLDFSIYLDQIVMNKAHFNSKFLGQIDRRSTNFLSIFNGFSASLYACYFDNIEILQKLFPHEKYIEYTNQIAVYNGFQYYIFNGTFSLLLATIIANSVNCFNFLVNQMKSDEQFFNLQLQQCKHQLILKVAAMSNFLQIFKQPQIMAKELSFINISLQLDIFTPSVILEIVRTLNNDIINSLKYFLTKYSAGTQFLEQIYVALPQRIDGCAAIDYAQNLDNVNKLFIQNLTQQALFFMFKRTSNQIFQNILMGYYFFDDDYYQEKLIKFQLLNKVELTKEFIYENDNFIDESIYCNIIQPSSEEITKQHNWVGKLKFSSLEEIIKQLKPNPILYEERETNLIFNIFKGFNQLHYSCFLNKYNLVKFYLKNLGLTYTKYDTYIPTQFGILSLPKNSSFLHIALMMNNQEIINLALSFYLYEYLDVIKNADKMKENDIITPIKHNKVPCFELPIILIASITQNFIPIQLANAEFQLLFKQNKIQDIKRILSISIKYGNAEAFKRYYKIVELYSKEIAYQTILYRMPQQYIENLTLVQLAQRLSMRKSASIQFILDIEEFITLQVGKLNFYFSGKNKTQNFEVDKFYYIKSEQLLAVFTQLYSNYVNPKITISEYYPKFIAHDNYFIAQREWLNEVNFNFDALKFQINFSNQTKSQSTWFEKSKSNDFDYILLHFQTYVRAIDHRQTSQRHNIFFGFSGLHYAIIFNNTQIVSALAKHEILTFTKTDQIVRIHDEYVLIPQNSDPIMIACICKNQQMLDLLIHKSYFKLDTTFKNAYNQSYLDVFIRTGCFDEFLGSRITITKDLMNTNFKFFLKSNNVRIMKFLYEINEFRSDFNRQALSYGANDFPPEEVQNDAQRFIYNLYNQIEATAFDNLKLYQQTLISAYGKLEFNRKYQQYLISINSSLLTFETQNPLEIISVNQILHREVEIQPNLYFDSCSDLQGQQFVGNGNFDDRNSSYADNQFRGFSRLHYAIYYRNFAVAAPLSSTEFDLKTQFDNIIQTEESIFFIAKNTTCAQLAILCKFDKFIEFLSSKKQLKELILEQNLIYWIVSDQFPRNFDMYLTNINYNFIPQLYDFNSQNFISGLVSFLEITTVNTDVEKLITYIFTAKPSGLLFLKALEFCFKFNSNPKICKIGQKFFKNSIKEQYEDVRTANFSSQICDFQTVYAEKFVVQNAVFSDKSSENAFFDAVIANDVDFVVQNINSYRLKYDTRNSSNQVIPGFCALFYAIYYNFSTLVQLLQTIEMKFLTPFDIILPNKFFLSAQSSSTSLAVICDNQQYLRSVRPINAFDCRGFNYVFYSSLLGQQTWLIRGGIYAISLKKLFKWAEYTENLELMRQISKQYTEKQLLGNYNLGDGNEGCIEGRWKGIFQEWIKERKRNGLREALLEVLLSGGKEIEEVVDNKGEEDEEEIVSVVNLLKEVAAEVNQVQKQEQELDDEEEFFQTREQ